MNLAVTTTDSPGAESPHRDGAMADLSSLIRLLDDLHSAKPLGGTADGLTRGRSAAQTWSSLQPVLSRFGVTRVADITGLDRLGIPVAYAVQPASRSLACSQGKALTQVGAKVGAAMEAIEAWCAALHEIPTVRGGLDEALSWTDLCDIEQVAGFDADQVDVSTRSTMPIRWTRALELLSGTSRTVPYEVVHLDFRLPMDAGDGLWTCSTVGLAAGNSLAEAVLHALLEVLEHHSDAQWRERTVDQRRQTRIDTDSLRGPAAELHDRLTERGLRCALWQQTSDDCAVPAVFAGIVESDPHRDWHTLPFAIGNGCHPNPHIASFKALIEAVQTRAGYISASRDDIFDCDYQHVFGTETLAAALAETLAPQWVSMPPDAPFEGTEFTLRRVLDQLESLGWGEVLAVDLTPHDVPFHVVKVIVPGARQGGH